MARHINPAGLKLLMQSEGCRLTAYPDPGTGGDPWTCGFGATGPDIVPGTVWTQAEADKRLMEDVARFEKAVDELVPTDLTSNEFSAICVFVYNVGVNAFKKSTLLRLLRQGDKVGAGRQLLLWTKSGTKDGKPQVMPGLVLRRQAELALYKRPDRG